MKDEDIKLPGLESLNFCKRWHDDMQEYARQAVRMNMPEAQPKPSEPEPFDLARAMAGEPIVTRDGRKVSFLGHVPGFKPTHRVIAAIEGNDSPDTFYEDGRYYENMGDKNDLFMAPKPKRTVWVNVWVEENGVFGVSHPAPLTQEEAKERASNNNLLKYIAIAHPIEIDA